MRKVIYALLGVCIASTAVAQDSRPRKKYPEAASYSTRDATVMSMMGWGVILAVISAGVSVIFKEPSSNGTSSNNNHSH